MSNREDGRTMADFMQDQITRKQRWLRVETTHGTECVNVFDTGMDWPNSDAMTEDARDSAIEQLQDYVEGEQQSWENVECYGARMRAPGYLDCTEWTVFDSKEEAKQYLTEMYHDDE